MVQSRITTQETLMQWIKRQLGAPTRNVELTEEQLYDAIDFALEEVQPWYTISEYLTLDLNNRSAIDLSEYNVFQILNIFKIPNTSVTNSTDDPFSYQGLNVVNGGYGSVGTSVYISKLTNSDIHHVISAYAKQYNEMFYSRLAQIISQRTASTILPSTNYEFDRNTQTLYIGSGYPASTILTLEFVPNLDDFSKIKDSRYRRCCQDLALGQAMIILSRVVGKYDIGNAPSKINYEMYREDSEKLITHAREELKRISLTTYITD